MWLAGWAVIIGELIAVLALFWLYAKGFLVIAFEKGADVATLVLVAATLVVTGVGVAVAVVAIWGFREIRDRAVEAAVKAALKAVAKNIRGAFDTGSTSPEPDDADQIAKVVGQDAPDDTG